MPEGAVSARLVHGRNDKDYRNKIDEFNYLRMSSGGSKTRPSHGASTRLDSESEYPETISIVLRKSHREGSPSFLFTHSGEDQHLEFEGSDGDPEADGDYDGPAEPESDDDKQEWEKIRQQVKSQRHNKPSAVPEKVRKPVQRSKQRPPVVEAKKVRPTVPSRQDRDRGDLQSDRGQSETSDYNLQVNEYQDYSEPQSPFDYRQPAPPVHSHKDSRLPASRPFSGRNSNAHETRAEVRNFGTKPDVRQPARNHNVAIDVDDLQKSRGMGMPKKDKGHHEIDEQRAFRDLQQTERKPTSIANSPLQQSFVPVEAFNEMVSSYQSKLKALESSLASKEAEVQKLSTVPKPPAHAPSASITEQIVGHLVNVEGVLEECSACIEAFATKERKMDPRQTRDPRQSQSQVEDADQLVHLIRELLQDNECFIVDLQDQQASSDGSKCKHQESRSTPDQPQEQKPPTRGQTWHERSQETRPSPPAFDEEYWLGAFNSALGESPETSLEAVLERVRILISENLSFKLKASTFSEKLKSMQRQIDLSTAEFNRASEEKMRLEGLNREQLAEISKLRIELSNNTTEKKGTIVDTAKDLAKDEEINKLRRENQEQNFELSKLHEEIEKLKQQKAVPPAIEQPAEEPAKKQRPGEPGDAEKAFEYIKSLLVAGMSPEGADFEQTTKKLLRGPYGHHVSMIERLIQMQATKQEALAVTYRDKFLNENMLMQEIKAKLEHYDKLIEVLDTWQVGRPEQGMSHRDLRDLAPKSQRQAIKHLIQDVDHIIDENNRAIRDAITGDLDSFVHRHAEAEPFHSTSKSEEDVSFSRHTERLVGPQAAQDQSRDVMPYSPSFGPKRSVEGSHRRAGEVRKRLAVPEKSNISTVPDLGQLLTAQSLAIEKYEDN